MRRAGYILVIVACALAFFWRLAAFPAEAIYPNTEYNARGSHAGLLMATGDLPLWDPDSFGGAPLVGAPLAPIFFPFFWLGGLGGLVSPDLLPGWCYLFHAILAGVSTFLLARRYWGRDIPALVSALCFMLNGGFIARMHDGQLIPACAAMWLPAALLSAEMMLRSDSWIPAILAGAALTMVAFLGDIESLVWTLAIFAAYVLARGIGMIMARDWAKLRRGLWRAAGTLAVFISTAAVWLAPAAEIRPHLVIRAGPECAGAYVSIVMLLLGAAGAIYARYDRAVRFWMAAGAFCGLWMLLAGGHAPSPPSQAFSCCMLALSLLAGLGFGKIIGKEAPRARAVRAAAGAAVMGLLLLELSIYGQPLIRTAPPEEIFAPTEAGLRLKSDKERPLRVLDLGGVLGPGGGARLGLQELSGGGGGAAMDEYIRVMSLPEGRDPATGINPRLLDVLGCKYVLSDRPLPRSERLALVSQGRQRYGGGARSVEVPYYIYLNKGRLPRAYVVGRARILKSRGALAAELAGFDPAREVILESMRPPVEGEFYEHDAADADSASIEEYAPDRVRLKASAERGGFLVLGEAYHPGWKAAVDGRPVPVLRANGIARAVFLSPGGHEALFEFRPAGYVAGRNFSILALAVLGLLAIGRLRRAKSAAPAPLTGGAVSGTISPEGGGARRGSE